MDASSDEIKSPELTSTPITYSKSTKTESPEATLLSPLSKSRYGRTRKPKISEDFYNIDVIFESARDAKKSPRAVQADKPKAIGRPPKQRSESPRPKRYKKRTTHFVHVTGDDMLAESASSESSFCEDDLNSKAIHNFFNQESGMSMLQNSIESKGEPLNDDLQSVDVKKVLKIISTRSPDPLQSNLDPKSSFKPVLKTYTNKRKSFQKHNVVESFGLPDTPIFPLENEKSTEPKRIKNLDVAPTTSERDINIVDKKLLDTPWKIASINADIENESLLENSIAADEEQYLLDTEFLIPPLKQPVKESRDRQSALKSSNEVKELKVSTKTNVIPLQDETKALQKGSPKVLEKRTPPAVQKSPKGSSSDSSNVNKITSPRVKVPRKQKQVIREELPQEEEDLQKTLKTNLPRKPKKKAINDKLPTGKPSREVSSKIKVAESPKKQKKAAIREQLPTEAAPQENYKKVEKAKSPKKANKAIRNDVPPTENLEKIEETKSPRKQKKAAILEESAQESPKDDSNKIVEAKSPRRQRKAVTSEESLTRESLKHDTNKIVQAKSPRRQWKAGISEKSLTEEPPKDDAKKIEEAKSPRKQKKVAIPEEPHKNDPNKTEEAKSPRRQKKAPVSEKPLTEVLPEDDTNKTVETKSPRKQKKVAIPEEPCKDDPNKIEEAKSTRRQKKAPVSEEPLTEVLPEDDTNKTDEEKSPRKQKRVVIPDDPNKIEEAKSPRRQRKAPVSEDPLTEELPEDHDPNKTEEAKSPRKQKKVAIPEEPPKDDPNKIEEPKSRRRQKKAPVSEEPLTKVPPDDEPNKTEETKSPRKQKKIAIPEVPPKEDPNNIEEAKSPTKQNKSSPEDELLVEPRKKDAKKIEEIKSPRQKRVTRGEFSPKEPPREEMKKMQEAKSPRKQKKIILEGSSVEDQGKKEVKSRKSMLAIHEDVPARDPSTEDSKSEETKIIQSRSPRKRKQPTSEDLLAENPEVSVTPKPVVKHKQTQNEKPKDIKSPIINRKGTDKTSTEAVAESKSPKKSTATLSKSDHGKSLQKAVTTRQSVGLIEAHAESVSPRKSAHILKNEDMKSPQNRIAANQAHIKTTDIMDNRTKIKMGEPRVVIKERIPLRKHSSLTASRSVSSPALLDKEASLAINPIKLVLEKRKRSESPKKRIHIENTTLSRGSSTPEVARQRGRPRKRPSDILNPELPEAKPTDLTAFSPVKRLNRGAKYLKFANTSLGKKTEANESSIKQNQKETVSPIKRSSRLAKILAEAGEDISKEIKEELISGNINVELDEMSLMQRILLQKSDSVAISTPSRRSKRSVSRDSNEEEPMQAEGEAIRVENEIESQDEGVSQIEKKRKLGRPRKHKRKSSIGISTNSLKDVKSVDDVVVKDEFEAIELGDLMWARIRGYPFWPCLITEDPITHEFKNNCSAFPREKDPVVMYHVRFFGDRGRRAWIRSVDLIRFRDKNDVVKLHMTVIKNKPVINPAYSIRRNLVPKWNTATAEAESLKLSTVQERFDFFFNMFASEEEKRQRLLESQTEPTADVKEEGKLQKVETEHSSRSRSKLESPLSLKQRSKSLPPQTLKNEVDEDDETSSLKEDKKMELRTKDDSEKPEMISNLEPELSKIKRKKESTKNDTEKQLTEPDLKSVPLQKRATKIKERQESNDSSVEEPMNFLKSPWQGLDLQNKHLDTPLNEANSECSLSDSDTLSKSSTNTVVPGNFKAQIMRQRRNNLFRGVLKYRVCQVCTKSGEMVRCKGPCNGIFHAKCAAEMSTNVNDFDVQIEDAGLEEGIQNSPEASNEPEAVTVDSAETSVPSSENNGHVLDEALTSCENDTNVLEEILPRSENSGSVLEKTSPVEKIVEDKENNKNVISDAKENIENANQESSKAKDAIDNVDNSNNKAEVMYVDCDDSDLEHALTPKVRLTPSTDVDSLSLADQIDMKMKEVMQNLEKKTRYADSTTDYTSSEDSNSNIAICTQKPKVSQKKKSSKIKHVTADHISFASSASSEDLICENSNTKNADNSNKTTGVTSSENAESIESNQQTTKELTSNEVEKHITGEDEKYIIRDTTPHSEASNELNTNKDDFKCIYCISEIDPPCFVCEKQVTNKNESVRQKCSIHKCGKFYHPSCLKLWPQTQWSLIPRGKQKNSQKHVDTFVCPAHVCHTCASDDPRAAVSRCPSDKVVKCLRCPATYHTTNYCVPAGTIILSTFQIVCPRHLGKEVVKKGRPAKHSRTINTPWCFICSKGGDLVCCETCPTSVHTDCLAVNFLEDGTFICEDCETGRFPLYDEIVWVKLGAYRWWPAVILFPNEVPDNVNNLPHNKGEFVVKFFGTHDHYWVGRGRVFLFQEGDRGHCSPVKRRVDALFKKSIEEAAAAHEAKKLFKTSKEAEIKTGTKPPPYIRVKVNKPVGNIRLFDGNVSNTNPCNCDPNQDFPCGSDKDCLNRMLLTECDPNLCPAKEKCNNQRFEKRLYPPLEPSKTEARGWGLKTLAPIPKGDFVIEYVGEIINEQEYLRRIHKMHDQKDENYYFLTIDKDRIIDAGPKGNLARFMNHCCQPNCETQKWTVNGKTRVGLFALCDIPAESELTFNYNLECIGKEKKICKCGAPNCSGFIGVKVKPDESQKKLKKLNNVRKKKRSITPQVFKNEGPCFVCGKSGGVGACCNKLCSRFYHLKCVNLESWPEGKWICPWHNCNICTKRTIRCCVKCLNSYCPVHSEGNIRHYDPLGFVCLEHDPAKESHELSNQNLTVKNLKNSRVLTTEETDVTSTTSDEIDSPAIPVIEDVPDNMEDLPEPLENRDVMLTESVTSTPIKKKQLTGFARNLQDYECEGGFISDKITDSEADIPEEQEAEKPKVVVTAGKRKRGRQKSSIGNMPKKLKLSDQVVNQAVVKPKPNFATPNVLDMPAQNEVKLSSSVPTRHLRTTRNTSTNVENKRFLKQQSELEKDLPIRKRSRPRSEAVL